MALGPQLSELIKRSGTLEAQRLLLALGHVQASSDPDSPETVLPGKQVPPRTWRAVGIARSRVVRVCLAAARCDRALDALQGDSDAILRVRRDTWAACFGESLHHALELERVIRDHDVLIQGETGTGKELVARAIQGATPGTADGGVAPATAINAAAIPETLIESELFGHVKGAFTGASETRVGRLRAAHRGSLFLDEVGDLRPTTQVKLLRVMETNEVTPLGSDRPHTVDVRYVAATHEDLGEMVTKGRFREDLFQRLAGSIVCLPPLRERPQDIVAIGLAFVRRHMAQSTQSVSLATVERWLRASARGGYAWPGNVRELQNALRDLMLGLPPRIDSGPGRRAQSRGTVPRDVATGTASLQRCTDWYIQHVLRSSDGNVSEAARALGVDRSTLYRRVRRRSGRRPES